MKLTPIAVVVALAGCTTTTDPANLTYAGHPGNPTQAAADRAEHGQGRPTRVIPGMTAAQARDQVIAQCAMLGANPVSTDPSHIVCEKDAGIIANALLTTGVGPQPKLQLHVVAVETSAGLLVTGWETLQSYTWTGSAGLATGSMNRRQYQDVSNLLASLHPDPPN